MSTEFTTDLIPYAPGPAGMSAPARGIDIKRMLRLRLPLMILVFLVLAVPAATAIWMLVPEEFTASTRLEFSAQRDRILYNVMGGNESTVAYERWVNTNVAYATDRAVLSKVLIDARVKKLPVIASQPDKITFLQEHIQARPIRGTEFIEVSATFGDRKTAQEVATVLADQLAKRALDEEDMLENRRYENLIAERDKARQEVDARRQTIQSINAKIQAPYMTLEGMTGTDALQRLVGEGERAVVEAEAALSSAQTTLGRLKDLQEQAKKNPGQEIYEFDVESRANSDPEVNVNRQETFRLESAIAASNYQDNHPSMRQLKEQLAAAESRLERARARARQSVLAALTLAAEQNAAEAMTRVARAQEVVEGYRNKLAEERKQASSLVADIQKVEDEKLRLAEARQRLLQIEEKVRQFEVEREAQPRVKLTTEGAMAPVRPNYGRRIKLAFLAVVGAAGMAFGVGLLRELTDQQLRSSADVTYITPLPVLATIPHLSLDKLPAGASPATLAGDFPDSISAEEFRRVLTRIIYPPEGAVEIKTILVTSPSRGDGKTAVACNLAISLAEANRRVLLVDISARRPGVERCFNLEPEHGLAEVLAGEFIADEVIRETDRPGLYVLGPGFTGRDVTGKLASREAVEFFEGAEHAFDHVIIDTPPCLLMSDAKLLAPVVDGVVMVVGAGISTIGMMRRCLLEMQHSGSNVLGIILNGVRPTRGGYLRRNRDAYYAYHGENGSGGANGSNGASGSPGHAVSPASEEDENLPMILLVDERPEADDSEDRA